MLTPVEMENIKFRRSYRGYNVKEVLNFKEQLQEDYEHLYKENIELNQKIDELNKKLTNYQVMEENLRNAVILAQKTAEEVKITAQSQADIVLREAVQQGEQVKVRIREEIQEELQNLSILKNQVQIFKSQFKSFLTSLLEIADHQIDMADLWNTFQKVGPHVQINAKTAPIQTAAAEAAVTEENSGSKSGEEISNNRNGGVLGSPEAFLNLNKDWE